MIGVARVRRTQLRLVLLSAARAVGWAGAVLFGGLAGAAAVPGNGLRLTALLAAATTLVVLLWRDRFVWSVPRVALWLEERLPALRYLLVTGVDPRYAVTIGPELESVLAGLDLDGAVRRSAGRSAVPAVVALAIAALAFTAMPAVFRARQPAAAGAGGPGTDTSPSRLAPLRGTVTPPRYALEAGVKPQALDEPATIAGLGGSTVELTGPGAPDGIGVGLGDSALAAVSAERGRWRVVFTLPDSATALRLADRDYRRLIVLAPERDQPPAVQLLLPASDTTVREPTGSLTLDARLSDDLGLATARVEYIVSSGETEGSFTFREGTVGARRFSEAGTREARLRLSVPLATFKLVPGDQLSVRAVAIDNNTWSGPDTGYSEPRTLRVARPGEYDSLAVEGAPPPADSAMMTLRYLIQLTERLERSRGRLPRRDFVDSSTGLGTRAERLRTRVEQLQADQTMGGMFPPNPLLNTAYLALAEGEGALKVAEPGESLPHLRTALRALQKYAWAERYYLRGRGGDVLVDLARVRLTGADTGHAKPRTARGLADTTRVRLREAYSDALAVLDTAPDRARERLALLQVEALRADPALGAAVGEAIAMLQAGRDPAQPLQRARRLLDGPAMVADTLPRWSGAW